MVDHVVRSVLAHPCDPRLKGRPERLPCYPDPGHSPMVQAWIIAEIEHRCAKRGRPIVLVRLDLSPPTPTPGELLASSMSRLPALPPTAGGLCLPVKGH